MRRHVISNSARYSTLCVIALLAVTVFGCRNTMPHSATWPATGDIIPTHPEPPEGGYYSNWDPYAGTIEVEPIEDVNPVKTQHVLIATVRDHAGQPLPNRRVEWIISNGSVGDFVEVDESGWRASRGYKVTNHFAVTHTNNMAHTIDRGTEDPSDDIELGVGQTWVVITSPVEGTTHLTAYAPGIYDWNKHKVFVTKHWYDVQWTVPPPATNRIGQPHELTTHVSRISDGMPLSDYIVTYKLLGGPQGTLNGQKEKAISVETDAAGAATVTLEQIEAVAGVNDIQIDVVRPDDRECCKPGAHLGTDYTTKTWIAPSIAIQKNAPARGEVGKSFQYQIAVSNPSETTAENVVVTDTLPLGIEYAGSAPAATVHNQSLSWSLGTMAPQTSTHITVNVVPTQTGTFKNCAEVTAADGLSDRDCATTIIMAPQLAIELQCIPEAILCDVLPYRVLVRNTGDGPAYNVRISVDLPNGLATVDGRTAPAFDAGTLAPGQAKDATFNVKPHSPGMHEVQVTATGDGGLTAETSCQTEVVQPVLSITKTGPEKRYIGRTAAYEITVTNEGPIDATDLIVVDTLPEGVTFMSASNGGHPANGKVTWQLGSLGVGSSQTLSLTVQTDTKGVLHNEVIAKAYCAEARASFTTVVEGIPAILLEVVDVDDPIEVGTNTTYDIVVTNQGSAIGTNIVLTCILPGEEQYVSASGPTAAQVSGQTITFAPLPSLAPKMRATYRVVIRGVGTGDVRFKTSMTSDQAQVPVEETESTHIYE